jgi:hypothetical protein
MAVEISAHMEVVGIDDGHVGTVRRVEGSRIRLAKSVERAGSEHFVPVDWIKHVDDKVHLRKTASDAMREWRAAA